MAAELHLKASEEFHILYLDTKNHVVGMEMISRGTLNRPIVHPREVFKEAILEMQNRSFSHKITRQEIQSLVELTKRSPRCL